MMKNKSPQTRRWPLLELSLGLTILILLGQVGWPWAVSWWNLPRPGRLGVIRLEMSATATCMAQEFVVYLPKHYRGQASWPLIVYLHGSGSCGSDPSMLKGVSQLVVSQSNVRNSAVILFPQCRANVGWNPDDVEELIQLATEDWAIDSQRVYLVGFSMGGSGTWEAAAKFPELMSAIVPIAGGGSPEMAEPLKEMPIWAFHGDGDKVVLPRGTIDTIEGIQSAGGSPRMTIYSNAGHQIIRRVLSDGDMWNWLLRNRRSPSG